MSCPELPERVARACEERGLLSPGPLAVAVSGGVDSMVLMHILARIGARPAVISLDHGLRPESAREVEFVGEAAARLGLPFVGGALGVAPGPDVASRARAARYAFLEARPEPTIALAHHRDDQVETVLDRLARGAGAGGIGGMRWWRGRFVRPMLEEPRAEILAWARGEGISWVEDPSNVKGARGALRARVIPELLKIRAGAGAAIARSAALLAEDDALLMELARALLGAEGIERPRWEVAPEPLRRRALLQLVAETRGEPGHLSAAQIGAALTLKPGGVLALSGGWRLAADAAHLRCLPAPPEPARLQRGRWGIWQVEASEEIELRAPQQGERWGREPLLECLRRAGVPATLRPYHPVAERGGWRAVPGLGEERGKSAPPLRVVLSRPPSASWGGLDPTRFGDKG